MDFSALSRDELLSFVSPYVPNASQMEHQELAQLAQDLFHRLRTVPQTIYPPPIVDLYLASLYTGPKNQTYTPEQIRNLNLNQIQQFGQILNLDTSSLTPENRSTYIDRLMRILKFLGLIIDQNLIIPKSDPLPQINVKLSQNHQKVDITEPIRFQHLGRNFQIDRFLSRGASAQAYEGVYENIPVVYLIFGRVEVPEEIKQYFPIIYFSFRDIDGNRVDVIERLYAPVYSEKFYQQAMEFLNTLDQNNLKHGDLSMNNVMMDKDGNFRVIDYSPGGGQMTRGYGGDDKKALSIVLFELKNRDRLFELFNFLMGEIRRLSEQLPPSPPSEERDQLYVPNEYAYWVTNMDQQTRSGIKRVSENNSFALFTGLMFLYRDYLKITAALEFLSRKMVTYEQIENGDDDSDELGVYIDAEIRNYREKFEEWMKENFPSDRDQQLLETMFRSG